MKNDFLYKSLGVGFFIVALVFFYEDYSSLFGFSSSSDTPIVDVIDETQEMTPPPDKVSTSYHTVQNGETVYSIAQKYNMLEDRLVDLNLSKIKDTGKLKDGKPIYDISVGDQLKVVGGNGSTTTTPVTTNPISNPIADAGDFIEKLNCGDSFCPHSKKTLRALQAKLEALNTSTARNLVGQLTKIDKAYHSNGLRTDKYDLIQHEVKEGETVYSIQNKYKVKLRDILKYNRKNIKAKMNGGMPEVDPKGRAKYDLTVGSKIIVFPKK